MDAGRSTTSLGLGRSVQVGEEGQEASLRRRGHYQLRGTLAVPGWRREEDVGRRVGVPLVSQSDGWACSVRESVLNGGRRCSWAGGGGGGGKGDLALVGRRGAEMASEGSCDA
jgi:hypothetical protein